MRLTEEEKKRIKYLYSAGWSYREKTQDTLEGRNNQLFQANQKEVEKCCVTEGNIKEQNGYNRRYNKTIK